jgi:hypothetical protein
MPLLVVCNVFGSQELVHGLPVREFYDFDSK